MNYELNEAEAFLKQYGMKLGRNKTLNGKLLRRLNRDTLVSRSVRCIYKLDNFIIKASSDATSFKLPVGADQCLNEFKIYHSTDKRLEEYKEIFCPIYAIYESKFLYLTVNKLLTPLGINDDSEDNIYDYTRKIRRFANEEKFFPTLEKFKNTWVTKVPELQNEYCKISSFGYDVNNNLYVLDYGML